MVQRRGCERVVGVSRLRMYLHVRRGGQRGGPDGAGPLIAPLPMRVFWIAVAARGPPHRQMCQTCPLTMLPRALVMQPMARLVGDAS